MVDVIDEPQKVVVPQGPIQGKPQPVAALENLDAPLDDAAVRAAIVAAESKGQDPMNLPMEALSQGQVAPTPPVQAEVAPVQSVQATPEVPQKFLKTDGTVDVEKIQASTKSLDEGIQKKETAIQKTVEDYLREYREKETKFRSLPNPENFSPSAPPPMAPPQTVDVNGMSTQQLEELIRKDFQVDPAMTTVRLIELALEKRLEPIKKREQEEKVRENVQSLAAKDPRVLDPQMFAKINEKLASDPDLWKLKNPHKAAWLEVKEELRLGEPSTVQAQPSKLSPVLGGGTPPSVPSSVAPTPQNVLANLDKLDLRDRRQEAQADEAIKALLRGHR